MDIATKNAALDLIENYWNKDSYYGYMIQREETLSLCINILLKGTNYMDLWNEIKEEVKKGDECDYRKVRKLYRDLEKAFKDGHEN